MTIPEKGKAYVLVSYNHQFIKSLPNIPPDTEKVFYKEFYVKCPSWLSARTVADRLAAAKSPEDLSGLELKPCDVFTADLAEAMRFSHPESPKHIKDIEARVNIKLHAEEIDEKYCPF